MRLFAAVLPPEDVAAELGSVVDELRNLPGADTGCAGPAGPAGTSRSPSTARCRRGARAGAVAPAWNARRGGTAPFPLSPARRRPLRGPGAVGGRRRRRTTLRLLAERAGAAGRKAGVDAEEHRRYRPHLTLARSREETDFTPYVAVLDGFTGASGRSVSCVWSAAGRPQSGVPGEQPRYEVHGRSAARRTPRRGWLREGRLTSEAWTRRPVTGSWPVCSC